VTAFIQDNLGPVFLVLTAGLVVALVVLGLLARRLGELQRRLDAITRGEDGRSLQGVLEVHVGRVVAVGEEVERLSARTAALEASGRKAFQRIGLVRFNPFEDTGGNQSFALSLLDADDDGIVLSSLHSRSGTRIYTKSVAGGRPEAALSEEEAHALALARGATAGRVALSERASAGPGDH
jgi:Protein of unknown function (DUF4446)